MIKLQFIAIPKKVYVTAVASEGETELNAFDNCLLKIGIGDVSLVKVTSILPEDIEIVEEPIELPAGANIPAIYTYKVSSKPGERIAAAIALGKTKGGPTLVAEYSSVGISSEEAEKEASKRLMLMAKARNLELLSTEVYSVDHIVEKIGCALAVVVEIE